MFIISTDRADIINDLFLFHTINVFTHNWPGCRETEGDGEGSFKAIVKPT